MYITTEKGRLELTVEQEREIRNQVRIQDAIDLLMCYDIDENEIEESKLLELGYALEEIYYNNNGDEEYMLLQEMGFID